MTVAAANVTSGDDITTASSYATASVSLKAGRLYILTVGHIRSTTALAPTPTISGASQTWDEAVSVNTTSPNTRRRLTMFRCMPTVDASGALTIDFGGVNQGHCQWTLNEFRGVVQGGNGANALVQSASNEWNATNTGQTVTLAAFASPWNAAHGTVRTNGVAITAEAGYTELSNTTTNEQQEAEFKASADTTVSWTWASVSNTGTALAVEIAERRDQMPMMHDLGTAVG